MRIKKTATGSWGKVIASDAKNMGVAAHKNSCNGEVLIVDAKKNGKKVKLLLQSVPVGPGRNNVGIYYKALGLLLIMLLQRRLPRTGKAAIS